MGSRRSRMGQTRACRSLVGPIPVCLSPSCLSHGSQCRYSWVKERERILQGDIPISLLLTLLCHPEASKRFPPRKMAGELESSTLVASRGKSVMRVR